MNCKTQKVSVCNAAETMLIQKDFPHMKEIIDAFIEAGVTLKGDEAVQKLNIKAGYTKEGIGRQEFYRDGKYYDRVYWGLLKSEYLAQKNK